MDREKDIKDEEKEKNWNLSIKEIEDTLNFQRDVIDIIHNKSNWIVVVNVAFIVTLLGSDELNSLGEFITLLSFLISLYFAFKNFLVGDFKRGVRSESIVKNVNKNHLDLLEAVCKHKLHLEEDNKKELDSRHNTIKYSLYFLGFGLFVVFLSFFVDLIVLNSCFIYVL